MGQSTSRMLEEAAQELRAFKHALTQLVEVKDMPRGAAYEVAKDRAWERAREVIARYTPDGLKQ